MYTIYSHTPYEIEEYGKLVTKDDKRYVESFETKEDAETVLKALESVNISFNSYSIQKSY